MFVPKFITLDDCNLIEFVDNVTNKKQFYITEASESLWYLMIAGMNKDSLIIFTKQNNGINIHFDNGIIYGKKIMYDH